MQISNSLPQFDEKTLLIVTSVHAGKFFEANRGWIKEIASFFVPKPLYEDKEGQFRPRFGAGGIKSGTVNESRDDIAVRDFMRTFEEECKKLQASNIEKVFVFTPSNVKEKVVHLLPSHLKKKIDGVYDGIFLLLHPFKLIEMISEDKGEKHVVPTSPEAKKILDIPAA